MRKRWVFLLLMGLGPWARGTIGHAAEEAKDEVRDLVIDQGLPDAQPDEPGAGPVTVRADLAYYDGPDFDEKKHRLDLYLPARAEGFPVLLFIHGGAWRNGDRKLYRYLGRALAQKGVGVAVTSYRLSPQVQHPAHIEDVARAFAWVHAHVAEYGGDPTHLFVAGHSAGGHLAALLATNEQFLAAHNRSVHDIAGVLPISGVYDFDLLGLLARPLMQPVLGDDLAKWNEAAPVKHVRADLPPFRIFYGDSDFPGLDRQAEALGAALRGVSARVEVRRVAHRSHLTIIMHFGRADDELTKEALAFIRGGAAERPLIVAPPTEGKPE